MKAIVCILVAVFAFSWMKEAQCLSCAPCGDQVCPTLPYDCEPGFRVCGCCSECKGKEGDYCDNNSVQCESDLVCRNAAGEEKDIVYWFDFDFVGTCEESDE